MTRVTSLRRLRSAHDQVAQQQTTQKPARRSAMQTIGIGIAISVASAGLLALGHKLLGLGGK
jgi:hypothetical protein